MLYSRNNRIVIRAAARYAASLTAMVVASVYVLHGLDAASFAMPVIAIWIAAYGALFWREIYTHLVLGSAHSIHKLQHGLERSRWYKIAAIWGLATLFGNRFGLVPPAGLAHPSIALLVLGAALSVFEETFYPAVSIYLTGAVLVLGWPIWYGKRVDRIATLWSQWLRDNGDTRVWDESIGRYVAK